MPPAFNLSQDQTLQFNSCFFRLSTLALRLRSLSNGIESFLPCFHLLFSARRVSRLRSSHTDLFVAKFLKNFFLLLPPFRATRICILHHPNPFCKFRSLPLLPPLSSLLRDLSETRAESYQHFLLCQEPISRTLKFRRSICTFLREKILFTARQSTLIP